MGGWSPETVAGRINFEAQRKVISHEAIYQWIYAEAPHLAEYLTRHHSQRKPRGPRRKKKVRIPLRIPLNQRSEDANNRIESGHWESDLIIGTGCFAIQSTVERVSRKTFLRRIPNKTANENRSALLVYSPCCRRIFDDQLRMITERKIQSITFSIRIFPDCYPSFASPITAGKRGPLKIGMDLSDDFFRRKHPSMI